MFLATSSLQTSSWQFLLTGRKKHWNYENFQRTFLKRFSAIVFPIAHRTSVHRTRWLLLVAWTLALAFSAPQWNSFPSIILTTFPHHHLHNFDQYISIIVHGRSVCSSLALICESLAAFASSGLFCLSWPGTQLWETISSVWTVSPSRIIHHLEKLGWDDDNNLGQTLITAWAGLYFTLAGDIHPIQFHL